MDIFPAKRECEKMVGMGDTMYWQSEVKALTALCVPPQAVNMKNLFKNIFIHLLQRYVGQSAHIVRSKRNCQVTNRIQRRIQRRIAHHVCHFHWRFELMN